MANSNLFSGSKLVAAAGTAVQVGDGGQKFGSVILFGVKAKNTSNTGQVYVGWSATACVIPIAAGASLSLSVDVANNASLGDLWVDADTNGDGVAYMLTEI